MKHSRRRNEKEGTERQGKRDQNGCETGINVFINLKERERERTERIEKDFLSCLV